MMRLKRLVGPEGVEIEKRALARLSLLAALVAGTMVLVLPATAGADARVQTEVPCVAYANAGASVYSGFGTVVISDVGSVVTSCHLTLVSGNAVTQPTRTSYGNCDLLQLPSGKAELSCHYAL